MTVPKWQDISCECGFDQFIERFKYRWHPNGGVSKGDVVTACAKCNIVIDPRRAMVISRKQQLEEQMEEINQQLSDTEAMPLTQTVTDC